MGVGLELYGRRRDGSEFPVEISLSPLETEDGMLATSAIRDISEWKRPTPWCPRRAGPALIDELTAHAPVPAPPGDSRRAMQAASGRN